MRKFLWFIGIFVALPIFLCGSSHDYGDPNAQLGGVLFGFGMMIAFIALLVGVSRGMFGTHRRFHQRMKRDGLW